MSKQAETKFKERVRRDLDNLQNCYFIKIQQVAHRGIPDFLMCLNGRFIGLELKRDEKQKPTQLQKWHLESIAHAGGMGIVINPKNWFDVLDLLKELSGMDEETEEEHEVFH